MNDFKIKETFFIGLSVFPLVDFFATYKMPYLSICVYLFLLVMFLSREIEYYILLIAYVAVSILSFIFSIVLIGFNKEQIYYIFVMLTFFMLGIGMCEDKRNYIDILYKMVILYFLVNTCIYVYRFIQYRDFSRVRGGMSIYGGNTAHFIYLAMLFMLRIYMAKEKEQRYFLMLGICVLNAVMFVSKGAMVITFIWILADMVHYKESKIFSKRNIMFGIIIAISCLIVCSFNTEFLNYIITRFGTWRNNYQIAGNILGERGLIFEFSLKFLQKNPIYLFFGIGPNNYKLINPWSYSNPHNLFMDVLMNTGIFGFLLFSGIVIKTFFNTRYKFYYFLCIGYATLEGIALFYVDAASCIMTGYAFMFIIVIFITSQKSELKKIL